MKRKTKADTLLREKESDSKVILENTTPNKYIPKKKDILPSQNVNILSSLQ